MKTEDSHLDPAVLKQLLELIGGDTEDLAELIESYLDESPGLMQQMREGVTQAQVEQVRRASHTLKSSSRDFGAMRLSQLCAELEKCSQAEDLKSAAFQLEVIESHYLHARAALEIRLLAIRTR